MTVKKIRDILETLDSPAVVFDESGKIVSANKSAKKFFNKDPIEEFVVGKKKAESSALLMMHTTLDNVPALIFVKDLKHRFLFMNEPFIQLLNSQKDRVKIKKDVLRLEDVIGKRDDEIFPDEYANQFLLHDEVVFENAKTHTSEYNVKIDNKEAFFLVSKVPLFDIAGNLYGLCGIASNITHVKIAENKLQNYLVTLEEVTTKLIDARIASEQANMAKTTFLNNMSHEIRTPLNGVIANASLLENTSLTEKQENAVHRILLSAKALLEILDRIIEYAKVEETTYAFAFKPFNILKEIHTVYTALLSRMEAKNLTFYLDYQEEIPLEVYGDAKRLREIMYSLLENAVKFTDYGSITFSAKCLKLTKNAVTVRFEIRDSGIGIAKDHQNQLFDKFYQVDSSPTKRYGGTGLGLAISKKLISKMNGSIGVESTIGEGSLFWFELSFALAKE